MLHFYLRDSPPCSLSLATAFTYPATALITDFQDLMSRNPNSYSAIQIGLALGPA